METKKLTVTGIVQGVGFRWTTQMVARRLGIFGNVKNNNDGSVTIIAQGEPLKLAQFMTEIKSSASLAAHVDKIVVENLPDEKPLHSFQVIC